MYVFFYSRHLSARHRSLMGAKGQLNGHGDLPFTVFFFLMHFSKKSLVGNI